MPEKACILMDLIPQRFKTTYVFRSWANTPLIVGGKLIKLHPITVSEEVQQTTG